MAKALVEVIGDSASAVRALEQTSVALGETGDAAKKASVDMDAYAASAAKAGATRAETLLGQSAALKQFSAANAGTTEGAVAQEAALKRQTQAYKLLGIQAATTGKSMTETAGTIGRGLTTYATVPAAFIGYEAVKQAMDFNQSLLLIRTQAGASQAELEHMNSAVLQLVQSGHSYGQTAQQMAQGLFYVESEGIRGGRALATIQAAAAGAAKGQTDMADTTNALTSAMKIWNVQADGAAKTMATIDAITATGKMHLQDLNEAFNTRFFSTAQAIGVPLEQAGALLDVFTKMGVPASSAATNLTTTFIRMVNPAKAAGASLQQLGLTTGQLGRDLQTGGITKALADLTAGYENLVKTQGPAAAEAAVFGSFGGSHGGGAALQAIKGYQSYLESLGQIQRLNNPATFWSQVSETMQQPAMKIKQDVAEIGADFIKLGTALAPTVTALAGGITEITSAFGQLPGPVKDAIGVVVGILAVGGPLGLAVSGLGKLVGGIGSAFRMVLPEATTTLTTVGTEADAASAQVELLVVQEGRIGTAAIAAGAEARGAFAGIGAAADAAMGPVGALVAALGVLGYSAYKAFTSDPGSHRGPSGTGGTANAYLHGVGDFHKEHGRWYRQGPRGALIAATPQQAAELNAVNDGNTPADLERRRRQQQHDERAYQNRNRRDDRRSHGPDYRYHSVSAANSTTFALPPQVQVEFERAKAGIGNVTREYAQVRAYLEREIKSGNLHGKALADAYRLLAETQNAAVSAVHKSQSQFDQVVHNDTLLSRARLDLANGEYAAAQQLLKQDQERLQEMLSEAKTSQERNTVLKQLAEVERMRHSKADSFQLSARLQMEIARTDAQAALNPLGAQAEQVRLAKEARAQAERAIRSNTLTMQGLIQAWQIVGQENQVIASATGLANSYHSVSAAAIADSVKGLTHAQRLQLEEQIAQRAAHRGEAPNAPTTGFGDQHPIHHRRPRHSDESVSGGLAAAAGGGRPMPVHIDVKLVGDLKKIISEVQTYERRNQQRAGGRR